jgi:ABC-2 type transport system permease protein
MAEGTVLLWRQYRLERKLFWRNPSAAFFNFLLPLLLLAIFGAAFSNNQHDLNVIVPGIAGMSVMSATFIALAYNMTFLRESGVLKRMRGTPLPGGIYLGGVACNAVANTVTQVAIIVVAGKLFFHIPWPRDWAELIVFVAAGVVCFSALGVALAHAIPNFDSAPAYVNAIFLPVILVSGVFYDAAKAPAFIKGIAQALPLTHLIDGLSGAMVKGTSIAHNVTALGVIAAWSALGIALAVRGFSWEQRRS